MISAIGRKPVIAAPIAAPKNRLFGDRGIAHAQWSELFIEADGRLEYAARLGDVLAQEYDPAVTFHLLRNAARDRVAIGQFRHAQPPSAYTSLQSTTRRAPGAKPCTRRSPTRPSVCSRPRWHRSSRPRCRIPSAAAAIETDRIALHPLLELARRPIFGRIGPRMAGMAIGQASISEGPPPSRAFRGRARCDSASASLPSMRMRSSP